MTEGGRYNRFIMNYSNRLEMSLEKIEGQANDKFLLQHLSKQNPVKTCTSNHVCKKEMAVCTSSGPTLTENKRTSSRVTSSNNNPTNGVMIPDIRLEPPSESMIIESLSDYDLSDELKYKLRDILSNARLSTSSESYQVSDDSVTLPDRYSRRACDAQARMVLSGRGLDEIKEDVMSRENDISTALKWIRQEILCMKEQDKAILKQFIQLQDSIFQLRSLYDMNGSLSDLSSLDGSTYSLNEQAKSPRLHRLKIEGTTCAAKLSVSLPNSPKVSRFKWTSRDIL